MRALSVRKDQIWAAELFCLKAQLELGNRLGSSPHNAAKFLLSQSEREKKRHWLKGFCSPCFSCPLNTQLISKSVCGFTEILLEGRINKTHRSIHQLNRKCNWDISNVGPTDQRAIKHGNKRPLVLTPKPLADITGQRSLLLSVSIPCHILHVALLFSSETLPHVLSILRGCSIFVSAEASHTAAAQMPAFVHTPSLMQATSGCYTMQLILHLFWGHWAFSEAKRGEQEHEGTKEPFPPWHLWTQILFWTHLLGLLHLPHISLVPAQKAWGSSASIIMVYLIFPFIRLGWQRAGCFLAG